MNYLFFLIIFLLPIGLAYAESGSNYDKQILPDGSISTTLLSYDRILINNEWLNYNFYQDPNTISFESGSSSFKLDKTTCDFALYESGRITKAPIIGNYKMEYFQNNSKIINTCTISPITQNEFGVNFFTTINGVKRTFDLSVDGVEWDSNLVDTPDGFDTTFKIIETCENCTPEKIEGDQLFFGEYILDLKNEQHNSLKSVTSDKGNYVMEYEKIVQDGKSFNIDPTFSSTNPTNDGTVTDGGNNNLCDGGTTKDTVGAGLAVEVYNTGSALDCAFTFLEYPITSIPTGATITDVDFGFDVQAINVLVDNCDYVSMGTMRESDSAANIWTRISTGTVMLNADAACSTTGNNKSVDFGAVGDSEVQARVTAASGFFSFGIKLDTGILDAINHRGSSIASEEDGAATPRPTLTIVYTGSANAVTDLVATDIRGTAVDLDWSAPTGSLSLAGYQLNQTTPWSTPLTIILNTTSLDTEYTVSSLTGSTNYSFRVSAITDLGFINATGNILNITTDFDPTASFTPGTFDINATGIDIRTFKFARNDTATSTILDVTYPNTFNATCNFYFKFAMTNNTYTNLADVVVNANEDRATFTFLGLNNDIIDVNCYDTPTNTTGRYLITQTHFLLQDQIEDFRNGTFGTFGQFGAFDFITITAVIISMVGFNRVNELVGVILSTIMIGALAYFGLIQWQTIFTSALAVLIFWAWGTHRKD